MLITQKDFHWTSNSIDMLGVHIPCNATQDPTNFDEIFKKIQQTCTNWANRQLTLMGKILILNTLIGSLFVYKITTMLELTGVQIENVDSVIRDFLWKGKKPKISLSTL